MTQLRNSEKEDKRTELLWRSAAALSLAVLAIGVLCGCGVGRPSLIHTEPAVRQIKDSYPLPLAYDIGVETTVSVKEGSEGLINAVELGREVAAVLHGYVFKQAAADKPESRHTLKVDLTDFELKYAGRSRILFPSILLWAGVFSVGSMFLGDECYSATGQVQVVLEDKTGHELWRSEFDASTSCNLSDFQRGWTAWDLYFPGPLVAHPHLESASTHVLPHFYRDIQLKLLDSASENPVPPPETDCAIIVGVGKFPEDSGASAEYAARDAQAFSELMRKRGGSYLEGTFNVLTGEVDGAQVLSLLDNLAGRRDLKLRRVTFYYAGCGQVVEYVEGTKHEILTSTDPLELEALVEKLTSLGVPSCALILDCGFSGEGGRCVPSEGAAAPPYPDTIMNSPDVAVLFACAPGQSAYEDSDAKHGVFTDIALRTLTQFPDTQQVTLQMLSGLLGFEVSRQARERSAELQEPVANAADAVVLPGKTDDR